MQIPNLIVSASGKAKSGKTHFSMTFPDPIAVFSFDLGARIVAQKFSDKVIDIFEYPMPMMDSLSTVSTGFSKFWNQVRADLYMIASGEDKKYKTIVIDTASALWEIIRYAFNEEENRAVGSGGKARNYGEPNARMYGVITRAQLSGKNLVLINYLKPHYVDDKETGELILDGWKRTEGLVDLVLETRRESRMVMEAGKKIRQNYIVTKIKDSRYGLELDGEELEMCTYSDLLAVLGLG